jgi:PAS domain S-box-containing protein
MPIACPLSMERFQSIADFAPVMLWRITSDFKRDWVNRAWLDYTGASRGGEADFAWLDRLHPDDLEPVSEHFDQAFAAREATSIEFRLRRYDGAYRWFLDAGAPVFIEGTFAGFVGCCVDVTQRKVIEERLEIARTGVATLLTLLGSTTPLSCRDNPERNSARPRL